ncbi:MAG: restriction endonuclease subunit S, partial [Planctomycetaceae bacterium]
MKVINVANILLDGTVETSNSCRHIALNEFEEKYQHFAIEADDTVVSSSGWSYGKVGRIKARHLPLMMNTSVIRFHPISERTLDSSYLHKFLCSSFFSLQIEAYIIGSHQPNFGPSHVKRMKIVVPPITTQCKIASILSAYDDLIENNTRRIAILEEMAQAIYREWFVNFRFPGHENVKLVDSPIGKIPEGWKPYSIGDVAKEIRRGIDPSQLEAGTPYFGLAQLPQKCNKARPTEKSS